MTTVHPGSGPISALRKRSDKRRTRNLRCRNLKQPSKKEDQEHPTIISAQTSRDCLGLAD